MTPRFLKIVFTLAALEPGFAWAQAPATPSPNTPSPNIEGYWKAAIQGGFDLKDPRTGGGRITEILNVKSGAARVPNPSRIVDPPDGKIPYQPWALAKQKDTEAHIDDPTKPEHVDTQARCLLDGALRPNFFGSFQIIQQPGYIYIVYEQNHAYRVIPMDGRPHVGPHTKLWMGDSRGHWEGKTLVIDITNLNAKARLDMVGDFLSENAHVVERITFVDSKTLNYEATVEDPTVYTRPWKVAARLVPGHPDDYEVWEDACHEGEKSADAMILRSDAAQPATAGNNK